MTLETLLYLSYDFGLQWASVTDVHNIILSITFPIIDFDM